jgi:hypothetical protein
MLSHPDANYKQTLVELGIYAIEHDEWELVLAITHLIRRRWMHE